MADNLNKAIDYVMERFDEVNAFFIEKIAEQIKTIGELNPTSINRLVIMQQMGANVAEINQKLSVATNLGIRDIFKIYQKALNDTYTDARFKDVLEAKPLNAESRARINRYVQNLSVQTAKTLTNYANTTAVSDTYKKAVDKAILATSTGLTDYNSATRDILQEVGYNGLQVEYESGYHKRLDTAIRQNIIDGTNQLAQNASLMMGEEIGEEYDAVEISAHAMSAPDHEPIQGRVFMLDEFNKLQNGEPFEDVDGNQYDAIKRPIGEWNCKHIAMSFSTAYSERRYTDKQLAEWKEANNKGCTINGKHYTMYQATQEMRKLETEIRRQKDAAVAAKNAGDMELRKKLQVKINALSRTYNDVASEAGLTPQRSRTSVEGFRMVSV